MRNGRLGRVATAVLVVALFGYIGLTLFGRFLSGFTPPRWWWVGALPVLWVVDRLLLAAEDRGWIYWRRRSASSTSFGNAMLEVQALLEPDKRHVVEERTRQRADLPGVGAPPDPDQAEPDQAEPDQGEA